MCVCGGGGGGGAEHLIAMSQITHYVQYHITEKLYK